MMSPLTLASSCCLFHHMKGTAEIVLVLPSSSKIMTAQHGILHWGLVKELNEKNCKWIKTEWLHQFYRERSRQPASTQQIIPNSFVSKHPQPEMLVETDLLQCLERKTVSTGADNTLKQVARLKIPEKPRPSYLCRDRFTYRQKTRGLTNTRKWDKE